MKKSLIALAVLAASGAAMAQSSVTLYGVVDLSVGKIEGQKVQMHGNNKVTNGNSRIGFRGVEDLGGGLKAGFNFELGVNAEDGSTEAPTFQRQANVFIEGGFGEFKMGRAYTPSYNGLAAWELTGAANYSVVANTYAFVGTGPRNSSQFSYKTPSLSGFSAEVGFIAKGDNNNASKVDANLVYANGPLGIGLSYNKVNHAKANYALGGKYDFGVFALAASYNDARSVRYVDINGNVLSNAGRRSGVSLGGLVKFDNLSFALDLTRDMKREYAVGATTVKLKKYTNGVVEAKYAMSKRTFVYADFLRVDDENSYGVGLRHNF